MRIAATVSALALASAALASHRVRAEEDDFVRLFVEDGRPAGWSVRAWNDVSEPVQDEAAAWTVKDGILHAGVQRGTWLMSDKEYDDFEIAYEFKLGPRGNSGLALRAPLDGDPAFDGMEFQMADMRYNPDAFASEITGGLYRAVAPTRQVYRPEEWNSVRVRLVGDRLQAWVNDVQAHDLDLSSQTKAPLRHDGSAAKPLKDRPRRGRIGFQELSRGDERVQIRNARLKTIVAP